MNKEVIGAGAGTLLSATGTALQTNEVLSTIQLVITIIGGLLTIAMALLNWWKNAKKDGKIDKEEIKAKLLKEIEFEKSEIERGNKMLSNPNFLAKA